MRYDKTDSLLTGAFKLVEKYDPDTYKLMTSEDWNVSTWLDEAFPEYWPAVMDEPSNAKAFGVTLSDMGPLPIPRPETFINPILSEAWADYNSGVPIELFVAAILVHEFRHRHAAGMNDELYTEGGELDAANAGHQFAHRLPGGAGLRVREMTEDHLRWVQNGNEES
jgi:hypothetical protein